MEVFTKEISQIVLFMEKESLLIQMEIFMKETLGIKLHKEMER
jgi:hypothetical protein